MKGSKAKMLRKLAEILHAQYPEKSEEIMYKKLKEDYKAGRLKI